MSLVIWVSSQRCSVWTDVTIPNLHTWNFDTQHSTLTSLTLTLRSYMARETCEEFFSMLWSEFLEFFDMYGSYSEWVLKGAAGKQTLQYPTLTSGILKCYHILSTLWQWHPSHTWLGKPARSSSGWVLIVLDMCGSYLGWVLKGVVGKYTLKYPTLTPGISRPYHIL